MTTSVGGVRGRWRVAALAAVLALGAVSPRPAAAQASLADGRFEEFRKAAAAWQKRTGPERQVVDMVCLVPDLPTFFEAVAAWDEAHFFPVLIDDVETTLKFLRAFRPARVVRLPSRAAAVAPEKVWDAAVSAVGRAWTAEGAEAPRGDAVPPKTLGATPPGVVVSAADSPSLAGAVALAAGRFQPLVRWQTSQHFRDEIPADDARRYAADLAHAVGSCVPDHDRLGDDCDFVTLAGDYPYKYADKQGAAAFDDLVLRSPDSNRRWAYAGRLLGDERSSVYRAMCSLFLQPGSALLYNTYSETDQPWVLYSMTAAANRIARLMSVTHRHGADAANMAAWHRTFDPVNRYPLLIINTHGGPSQFHPGGHTSDVPLTGPSAVLIIHSFSASDPTDPSTIAARWLANGSFAYYGSLNEPYLTAFRTPTLVAACLAENVPVVASVRRLAFEEFGNPWRLVFLGDPLFRLRAVGVAAQRLTTWEPVANWSPYAEFQQPASDAPEAVRLNWALKTALFRLQAGFAPQQKIDLAAVLLGIARERLEEPLRPIHDALLADVLLHSGRVAELLDRLGRIPAADRSADVKRYVETAQTAALQQALARQDFRQALALWNDVVAAPTGGDFVRVFTERVGTLATTPTQRADWLRRLKTAAADANVKPSLEGETKRIQESLRGAGR